MKYFLHVLVMGMLFSLHAFSQTVAISYKTGLVDNGCNLFNVANPITLSGIQHYPLAGGVGFYHADSAIYLKCQSGNNRATMLGTAYAIKYPFKEGYTYNIKVQSWQLDLPSTGQVNLSFSMIDQLPDPNTTRPDLCGPVDEDKWFDLANAVINQIGLDTNKTNRDVGTFLMNQDHNFLTVVAWMNPSGTLNLKSGYIRQVTITETPPTYALAPASVPKVCGAGLSQTFTITDVYNSGKVSSYEWDLGSDNNGWLYNGAAAPRLITTTSPSLSLSAADACTSALSNIVVRVTRPNGIFTSNPSVVTPTRPPLSISGPSELCSTGNYIVDNLPCNATVTWSTTYTNWVNLTPSGNSVTVDKIAIGNIILQATVTNLCSGHDTMYITKNIKVSGPPDLTLLGTFTTNGYTKGIEKCNVLTGQYSSGKFNGFVSFNAPTVDNVSWTALGGSSNTANILLPSSDGKSAEIRVYPAGGYGAWRVSASNACGSSSSNFSFWANKACPVERMDVQSNTGNTATDVPSNGITISPNPASTQITIAIGKNNATITEPNNTDDKITGVKIYDVLGRLRKNQRYNKVSNITLTVSDLASGLYFVEIIMGKGSVKRNLNIKR